MFKNKKGFTLLELLVVVLIIGILASIALPQYRTTILKSEYSKSKLYVETLHSSIKRYHLAHGTWPKNISALDILLPGEYKEIRPKEIFIPTFSKRKINCFLWYDGNGNNGYVGCDFDKYGAKMRYAHNFQNNNRRYCYTNGSAGSINVRLCQQETGQETPTGNHYYY